MLQILVLLASTTGDRRPRTWRQYLEGAGTLSDQCLEKHPDTVIDTFLLETGSSLLLGPGPLVDRLHRQPCATTYYDTQTAIALECPTVISL